MIETKYGNFELVKNYKEAFDIVKFEDKYLTDVFQPYMYIVGDVSSEKLRLKGFTGDAKGKNGYKTIPDYLSESCNPNCPYYILKRVKVDSIEEFSPETQPPKIE